MNRVNMKKQLVEVAGMMYDRRLVNAFEGNLSIREGERIYITPSAVCKGMLTEDMVMVTDPDGRILEGTRKLSTETKLHLGAYSIRKDIGAVIHTHSPYATAFAVANQPLETKGYAEMMMLFKKIPLAAYGMPSSDEVFDGVKEYLAGYDVVLLANHGIMAVGRDAYDAFFKIEAAETIAKVLYLARQLGGEKALPEERQDELMGWGKARKD